ncbi:hypothetical protein Taro_056761 [Colocasia esculenta]|uniref:Aminotransferase-like plant mobile domain-containing protein n=1 Tax=Colocasia esculenta TaxID=4460 RepID=A0A843XUR4_COLES|nr:hypothetical protein [Colocasia esculenta]
MCLQGEMRAHVSWTIVLAVFLAFPPFQRERVEEMGFEEVFRMKRMRVDPALTQALRSKWDAEATAFVFPWGHVIPSLKDVSRITGLIVYGRPVSGFTYPCSHDLAQRLLELPVERRSSLVPRESLGLFDVGKGAGESEDEHLDRLVRVSQRELVSEPGAEADLDLRRFLVLFLGRLLFATRGDVVHCHFLPLLEDLSEGWAYLHLPVLGRGDLTRSGLVLIACRWDPRRDSRSLGDQLERLQEAIDSYPHLDVVWQPYLGESDEGQPWLVQARPYFGRPGRSFRGLHDTTDWREQAKEQINNWEHRGKAVRSDATTDDAYLQTYALKYGGKVYKSARHQVDVAGEIASLRTLLYSVMQDREVAQRQTEELLILETVVYFCAQRRELERVRSTGAGGASSSRAAGSSPSLLEAQLARAVLRAEEAQRHLEEQEKDLRLTTEHAMELQGQRDQLQGQSVTTREPDPRPTPRT